MRTIHLAILLATLPAGIGCVVMTAPAPLIPPPTEPTTMVKTTDYNQTVKGDITEAERIEAIIQIYGDRMQAVEETRQIQEQKLEENRSQYREVEHITTPRYRHVRRSYSYGNYRSYYAPRHYRSPGIINTLIFGTLGGIIGHQSGHRDEGILIGAGYGLLRDLWQW